MVRINVVSIFSVALLLGVVAFSGSSSFAASGPGPQNLTYQGRIVLPNGSPEASSNVVFTLTVLSPGPEACILYQETQNLNMAASNGDFSLTLGTGTPTAQSPGLSFSQLFANAGVGLMGLTCTTGTSYTPNSGDARKLGVTFNDGAQNVALSPSYTIQSVPFAMQADQVQGLGPANLLQVNAASNLTQGNLASIFNGTNYSSLMTLLGGTSSLYVRPGSPATFTGAVGFTSASAPTTTAVPSGATDIVNKSYSDAHIAGYTTTGMGALGAGQTNYVLQWNGSAWTAAPGGGGGSGTVTSVVAGTGLTGGTITASGTIAVDVGVAANKIVQLDSSAKLPAVDGSQLTGLSASQIGAGTLPVNRGGTGSATQNFVDLTTAQTIAGVKTHSSNAIFNANVGIGTASPAGALDITSTTGAFLPPRMTAVQMNAIASPSAGMMVYNTTAPGVFVYNGSSWGQVGAGSGTVTGVSSANTDIGVATGSSTPVLTLNSGTGANQIVKLDGSSKLPAVDGSALTNMTASQVGALGATAAAGGDLTGNYPNPTIGAGKVTSAAIANNAITTTKLFANPGINYLVGTDGTTGANLTSVSCGTIGYVLNWTATGWGCTNVLSAASPAFTGTPTAPTATAGTNTTQVATTAFVGTAITNAASSTTPVMNGTAAVGVGTTFARADHVHPTDTSRAPSAGSASITTLGTIGTGVWQGSAVGVPYGGTGQTSYTDGQLLIGNSSGNTLTKATLTAGTNISITNGNGSITINSTGGGGAPTTSKYILQGTSDASLTNAQFLGALGTGLVKNTTSTGVLSIAAAGTDYAPATSGSAILKGNGSGGFSSAVSATDYAPATTGTSMLKANGLGGFSSAAAGTDYLVPAGGSSITTVGTIGTGTWQGTAVGVGYGGTGQSSYTDGQLLIGNSTGNTLTPATLTAGTGVTITNGHGTITISASGGGGGSTTQPIASKSANYTVNPTTDAVILGNASSGSITITLPSAAGIAGKYFTIKKTDSSSNQVNIATTGSQTIDGVALSTGLASYYLSTLSQFTTIISDGTNWQSIGGTLGTGTGPIVFTSSGSITFSGNTTCQALVVAGGGGGGGGGVLYNAALAVSAGTYTVTVGAGGAGGTGMANCSGATGVGSNGGNSTFSTMTAIGGGGGGVGTGCGPWPGTTGGSGGGGDNTSGAAGTAGQGNAGGNGGGNYSGGGGGAGAVGGNYSGSTSGSGGVGVAYSISGTSTYYGGGGGGGAYSTGTAGTGGLGGGGNGIQNGPGQAGTANTGGGGGAAGGGATTYSGGAGGSGIVILNCL